MPEPSRTILLTGATGYVGGRLLPRLAALGRPVRCLARRPERLRGKLPAGVEALGGDLTDEVSLRPALAGVDCAYYLAHALASKGDFESEERRGAQTFAREARRAGVRRVIYLGGLGESGGLSPHLSSRRTVGRILRAAAPEVVELRAAVVIGAGSASFELVRFLVERLPVMVTPRWVRVPTQPIAIEDLLDYLVEALEVPARGVEVFELGGADVVDYEGIMREYARQRGLRRLILPVPFLTPRLSSRWLGLVTPVYARVGARLFAGLRHATVVRDDRARRAFRVRPRGLAQAVREALADDARAPRYVDARSAIVRASPQAALAAAARVGGPYRWAMEPAEPGRRARLACRTRLPGRAWLEFSAEPTAEGCRLTQTASFEPRGLGGRLYWQALRPAHAVAFRVMLRAAARRARRAPAG